MGRTIREKEPERPSTRVSILGGEDLTTTAKRRGLDAPKLVNLLRGDLDWIVMKRLEKDRARRYDTANGLASDIQRHLSNEPVAACPPSNLYRFQKLVRRNKLAFTAASAVAAALLIGLGISTWMFLRERAAKQEQERFRQEADAARNQAKADAKTARTEAAKSQQVVQFFEDMLEGAGPEVAKGRDATILKEILDKTAQRIATDLTNQPAVEADIRYEFGKIYGALGDYQAAELMQRRVIALEKELHPNGHRDVAWALDNLAMTFMDRGEWPQAEPLCREAMAIGKKSLGAEHTDMASWLNNLATILKHEDKLPEAEVMYREALAINKKLLGNEHREVAATLNNLALLLARQDKLSEAETTLREALQMGKHLWGDTHPVLARQLTSLTRILTRLGKLPEAEATGREAVAMLKKLGGPSASRRVLRARQPGPRA